MHMKRQAAFDSSRMYWHLAKSADAAVLPEKQNRTLSLYRGGIHEISGTWKDWVNGK